MDNSNVVGKSGYNYTNGQGEELVQWVRENGLPWVNSFHFIRRTTWYNRSVRHSWRPPQLAHGRIPPHGGKRAHRDNCP